LRGGRSAAALLATGLAVLAGGCGGSAPVEEVRVLQLTPATLLPSASGGQREVAAQPALLAVKVAVAKAPTAAARAATSAPIVQVPDVGSVAVDEPFRGRLVNGLQLPEQGLYWATWDAILHHRPNRPDRRWGTDRLISFLVTVLRDYHLAHPTAPRVLIGDLSRPFGGPFGSDFGGLGHHSHQNGLDVDVFYPRADRTLQPPAGPQDVDHFLAQDLVNRFVAYGAQFAFVGPHLALAGPPAVVQPLAHHDDHVHVRILNTTSGAGSETARR
jgi:murein endopeptidase